MALVGDFKIIVTNQTLSPIFLQDVTGAVTDPSTAGVPTVPAGIGVTLELTLSPSALVSWERGRIKAEINLGNVVVTSTGGGGGGGPQTQNIVYPRSVANPDGTVVIGQFEFDASLYTATNFYFRVTASVTAGQTGTVSLYNLTDGEPVTAGSLTWIETAPTPKSGTLTKGSAAGNLKDSPKVYEVRASVTGSTVAHILTVGSTSIQMS